MLFKSFLLQLVIFCSEQFFGQVFAVFLASHTFAAGHFMHRLIFWQRAFFVASNSLASSNFGRESLFGVRSPFLQFSCRESLLCIESLFAVFYRAHFFVMNKSVALFCRSLFHSSWSLFRSESFLGIIFQVILSLQRAILLQRAFV